MKRLLPSLLLTLCLFAALSSLPTGDTRNVPLMPTLQSVHAGDGVMIPGVQPTPTPAPLMQPAPEESVAASPSALAWLVGTIQSVGALL